MGHELIMVVSAIDVDITSTATRFACFLHPVRLVVLFILLI